MNEFDTQNSPSEPGPRIPALALGVVLVGLLLSAVVYKLAAPDAASPHHNWSVVQRIGTTPAVKLGPLGSLRIARSSVSALAPNPDGSLLFELTGIVTLDSGGWTPTGLRCDVTAVAGGTRVARTPHGNAAWPPPGGHMTGHEVADRASILFDDRPHVVVLPIRDTFMRYADSPMPIDVEWPESGSGTHSWVWHLPEGTGDGAATMGYAVVFRTRRRPAWTIRCRAITRPAKGTGHSASLRIPVRLEQWPIEMPTRSGAASPPAGA